jgi:putative membrane protein
MRLAGLLRSTLLPLVLAACAIHPSAPPPAVPAVPPVSAADTSFLAETAAEGDGELAFHQLAKQRSRRRAVQAYADDMVSQQTELNNDVHALAAHKGGIPAIEDPPPEGLSRLAAESGAEFDHDYLLGRIADRETALKNFQQEVDSGSDPEVKEFARQSVPKIEQHLRLAREIAGLHVRQPMVPMAERQSIRAAAPGATHAAAPR